MISSRHNLAFINDLSDHVHSRTYGRLRDLKITQEVHGGLQVSATAHSRFVRQLAEWAVLEWVAPADVQLSISVCLSASQILEVQK